MKKKKIIGIISISLVVGILLFIGLSVLKYKLSDCTNPKGWKIVRIENNCKMKIPKNYIIEVDNSRKSINEHKIIIKEKNRIKYVGKFFDTDYYSDADSISFKIKGYSVRYYNNEDKQKWYDGGSYSNGGSWFETKFISNGERKRDHIIKVDNDFGKEDRELTLVLVGVDKKKSDRYITDNITRNVFYSELFEWFN